jgi:hypothetical protein
MKKSTSALMKRQLNENLIKLGKHQALYYRESRSKANIDNQIQIHYHIKGSNPAAKVTKK